jgi:hypothetical protein
VSRRIGTAGSRNGTIERRERGREREKKGTNLIRPAGGKRTEGKAK